MNNDIGGMKLPERQLDPFDDKPHEISDLRYLQLAGIINDIRLANSDYPYKDETLDDAVFLWDGVLEAVPDEDLLQLRRKGLRAGLKKPQEYADFWESSFTGPTGLVPDDKEEREQIAKLKAHHDERYGTETTIGRETDVYARQRLKKGKSAICCDCTGGKYDQPLAAILSDDRKDFVCYLGVCGFRWPVEKFMEAPDSRAGGNAYPTATRLEERRARLKPGRVREYTEAERACRDIWGSENALEYFKPEDAIAFVEWARWFAETYTCSYGIDVYNETWPRFIEERNAKRAKEEKERGEAREGQLQSGNR